MRKSVKTGFSFGLTSGVITTLGLMVGLYSGTGSKLVVIGGILTIAIADALSDALGIHISQESLPRTTEKDIWTSTFSTFFSKFVFALSFILPILIFQLSSAIWICVLWGIILLSLFSFKLAKERKISAWKVIFEHLLIALTVILITYLLGQGVARTFH